MRVDAQRKRQAIIDAAVETFRTVPEAHVTLDGIAQSAGVGIATLYRHFPTRRDLRIACALNLLDTLNGYVKEADAHFDDDPAAQWEKLVWKLVDAGMGMLIAGLVDQASPHIDKGVLDELDQFFNGVEHLLDHAASYGLVDPDLSAREIAAELLVVTRPQGKTLTDLFPDVKHQLIQHLLQAWRQPVDGN